MDSVRIAIIEDEVDAKEHLASCINGFFNSEGMPFSIDYYATVDSFPLQEDSREVWGRDDRDCVRDLVSQLRDRGL